MVKKLKIHKVVWMIRVKSRRSGSGQADPLMIRTSFRFLQPTLILHRPVEASELQLSRSDPEQVVASAAD